jgi:hypothetical protein
MIKNTGLSPRVLSALWHSPTEPAEARVKEEGSMVGKQGGVKDSVAVKNGGDIALFQAS